MTYLSFHSWFGGGGAAAGALLDGVVHRDGGGSADCGRVAV
jgi:hypothetical protein